jgi:tetratricopeptide (TPR) repeat protein
VEWLERAGETDAVLLAGHWLKAGEREKAAAGYHRAAAQALEAGDFAAAIERVKLARECGLSGEAGAAAELIEVEALRWGGNQIAFLDRGEALLPRLEHGSVQWLGLLADLSVMSWRLKGYVPRDIVEKAKALLSVDMAKAERAAYLRAAARVVSQAAIAMAHANVEPLTERAWSLAADPALQDPSIQAWVEQMRGFLGAATGELATAGHGFETAARLFDSIGDRRNALAERVDTCFMLLECGRLDDLISLSKEVAEQCRELRLSRLLALARILGLFALTQQGRAKEVLTEMRTAAAELPTTHSHFVTASLLLAETELAAGDPRAALATADRAIGSAHIMQYWYPEATTARALLAMGRVDEALARLTRVPKEWAVLSNITGGYERYELARTLAFEAVGRHDEARTVLRNVRDAVLVNAAVLKEPDYRRTYISNSRERTALMTLAAEWGI